MKLKVIFLKKKYFYYLFAIIAILVLTLIFILSRKTTSTFSTIVDNTIRKADFTGDGKEDILYIKRTLDKYYIQVNTDNNNYMLEPSKKLNTLGSFYDYNPMKLTLMDISRNKVPEIFIQALEKDTPIQHIFLYDSNKFEDIFCSTNNFLGFMDSNNNKTPRVLSGSIKENKIEFTNYMLINNKMQNFSYNYKENFMGKDTVMGFIKYIETLPSGESAMPKDIFYPGLNGNDLAAIGKLSGENNSFIFLNAWFKDTNWNKAGEISEVIWSFSFKGISNVNKDVIKSYVVNLKLRPHGEDKDGFYYKIYSMSLE